MVQVKQHLSAVTVQGYASIRSAEVSLDRLNVLVGANGSGKSNFISALELLGRIVDERLQVFVGVQGGASDLLHDPSTKRIELSVRSLENRYRASLVDTQDDKLIFEEEETGYLSPHTGRWTSRVIGRGQFETALHDRAKRKGSESSVEQYVISMLRGCRVYHFHDTSSHAPVKRAGPTGDNLALQADAGNLAAVLQALRDGAPPIYRQILEAVRLAAPFFGDFVLKPESETDKIRLRWRHADSDRVFSAHQLSDGTLRFISLATLLLDHQRLPALVVLDEPELGLHPFAIVSLADMLRAASLASQVVVATQSVTLIDHMEMSNLIVVERQHGSSQFHRRDPDELRDWLDEYSVGELWQKALIGGRPAT